MIITVCKDHIGITWGFYSLLPYYKPVEEGVRERATGQGEIGEKKRDLGFMA